MGLLGGGGSILTVPIFVYLFKLPATIATGYSLFVVGLTGLIGATTYFRRKSIDIHKGLLFAIPSIIGVYISRRILLPAIPNVLMTDPNFTKDQLILIVFGALMFFASRKMIKKKKIQENTATELHWGTIGIQGLLTGILIGFVGAGGGFIIVPALVVLGSMEMKTAVGTSLMIIFLNSSVGFLGDLQVNANVDWSILLQFASIMIAGLFLGTWTSKKVSGSTLKPIFGYFVLLFGLWIIAKELFF